MFLEMKERKREREKERRRETERERERERNNNRQELFHVFLASKPDSRKVGTRKRINIECQFD